MRVFIGIKKAVLLASNTRDSGTVLADDTVLTLSKVLEADWAVVRGGSHLCLALVRGREVNFFEKAGALRVPWYNTVCSCHHRLL